MNRNKKVNMSQDGDSLNEQVSSKQSKGRKHFSYDIFSNTVNDITTYPQKAGYFSFFFFIHNRNSHKQVTTLKHIINNIKLCTKT